MIPNRLIVIGDRSAPYPLKNVDYLYGEIFITPISYDCEILNNYYISNYCRLYSRRYERLIKGYIDEGGYMRYTITLNNGNTLFTGAHKLGLMAFDPITNSDLFVPNHKDGNKLNNFIGNLEWNTVSENTRHALDTGLSNCKCENNSRTYLTNDTVHYICKMLEEKVSIHDILNKLGYEYGQERNRVGAIIRGIKAGRSFLEIASQYNIPGIKGRRFYPPEFTELVCNALNDPNHTFRIDELCDLFNIELEDRKMFKYYVDSILKGRCDTHITKKFPNMKRPYNVPKDHIYYDYYN